jgi:hypothetical protein
MLQFVLMPVLIGSGTHAAGSPPLPVLEPSSAFGSGAAPQSPVTLSARPGSAVPRVPSAPFVSGIAIVISGRSIDFL